MKSDFHANKHSIVCGLLLLAGGCVAPGSLDHRDQFESALKKQAAAKDGGADRDGGASAGKDASADKDSGAVEKGCPEACTLFAQQCGTSGCHSGSAPAGQLDLKSSGVEMRLIGKAAHTSACTGHMLIDSTSPDKSLIYGKLTEPPACGLRMPVGMSLTADQIACVRRFAADPVCSGGK